MAVSWSSDRWPSRCGGLYDRYRHDFSWLLYLAGVARAVDRRLCHTGRTLYDQHGVALPGKDYHCLMGLNGGMANFTEIFVCGVRRKTTLWNLNGENGQLYSCTLYAE